MSEPISSEIWIKAQPNLGYPATHIEACDTYWGSHSCYFAKGHEGPCACDCCDCDHHLIDHYANGCVAKPPYYGHDTNFHGDDIPQQTRDAVDILVIEEIVNNGTTQTLALPPQ